MQVHMSDPHADVRDLVSQQLCYICPTHMQRSNIVDMQVHRRYAGAYVQSWELNLENKILGTKSHTKAQAPKPYSKFKKKSKNLNQDSAAVPPPLDSTKNRKSWNTKWEMTLPLQKKKSY